MAKGLYPFLSSSKTYLKSSALIVIFILKQWGDFFSTDNLSSQETP